ncbi:MAG: hypothetical protein DRZ80_01645 [Thermoprotei archaeon]|nr:MAG: hypothetical protein DRZ80_01645 [Thermoprotei archaeon]
MNLKKLLMLTIVFLIIASTCLVIPVKAESKPVKILVIDIFRDFSDSKIYSRFSELLKDNGFALDYYHSLDFSFETLTSYDIIVIPDLYLTSLEHGQLLTTEQIAMIVSFVKQGGGLYLIEGVTPTLLSEFFKIHVSGNTLYDEKSYLDFYNNPRDVIYYNVSMKEIGYNVKEIVIPECAALQTGRGAYPLIKINNSTYVQMLNGNLRSESNATPIAYSFYGEGRIIAIGSLFFHCNFYVFSKDNPQFIINMFRWLAKKEPLTVNTESNKFRTYMYLGLLVSFLLIAMIFIWKSPSILPSGLKLKLLLRIFLSTLLAIYVVLLIAIVLVSISPISSHEYASFDLGTIIENITYYNAHVYIAVLIICSILFENIWTRADPELVQSMVKLALALGIAFILPTIYVYIFWFLENEIITPLWFFVTSSTAAWGTYFWGIVLLWIGLPIAWLWFRSYFERGIVYPELPEVGLNFENYRKLFYSDLYGSFIFKMVALITLVGTLPRYVLFIYSMLWGGELYRVEWFYILRFNVFLVIAFVLVFFMLRKAVNTGLTNLSKLNELKDLIFAREMPYLIIAMFLVPDILRTVFGVSDVYYILLNLLGIFAAYGVGYAAVRVLFSNLPRLGATLITGLIILLYQWVINTYLLRKITAFIEHTALAGVLSFMVTAVIKSLQKDFEKALKKTGILEKIVPVPPSPDRKIQELKETLEKLDKALIEGRIDLETYKNLKAKYEEELKKLMRK